MLAQLPIFQFHPVSPDRWKDFEKLFGQSGACAGCWSRSVWSLTCCIEARSYRQQGVTRQLLEAAVTPHHALLRQAINLKS